MWRSVEVIIGGWGEYQCTYPFLGSPKQDTKGYGRTDKIHSYSRMSTGHKYTGHTEAGHGKAQVFLHKYL